MDEELLDIDNQLAILDEIEGKSVLFFPSFSYS